MIKINFLPWFYSKVMKRKLYSNIGEGFSTQRRREELLSIIFITFLYMIIFLMIVFSLFYIGKGYLEYLHLYKNETLLTIVSFIVIGGVSLFTLLIFMKKNRERLKFKESGDGLFILDQKALIRLSACFVDGFLEAVLADMKSKG